jgi:hypothetical protein
LYNEKASEFDSKHIENWGEDANGLMILSGLVSAAVAGFLSQSYISFQTNSQDVSAFYLSQIYLLQASLNGSTLPTPAPPVPASKPDFPHVIWFASLMMSFVCAVGATMVQEWIRRYQLLTQLWSSPHRRSARIRASISRDRFLELIPLVLKCLNLLLHLSIYYFLAGLTVLPIYFSDLLTFGVVSICFLLSVAGYLCLFVGIFTHSAIMSPFSWILIYGRDLTAFSMSTLFKVARKIEKSASTRTSTLDADAMSWLLDSLTDEDEFERFLTGIPGFYKSTQVESSAEVLQKTNTDTSPKEILAFMDRSLSSELSELTRQRRIKVSLEAMQTHPYLLQRSFHHALRLCSTKSAIFKSSDFVLLADQYANDEDLNTRLLARCIIAIAINRLEDYYTDAKCWARIVQRRLNWPEDLFHPEQRDSIKLRNLIQLARDLNTPRGPDSDTLPPAEVFDNLLCEACKLDVGNAAPKLQNELCDLWNDLVIAAQLPDQDPVILSTMILILSSIRTTHVSLHHGTGSQAPPSSAHTNDLQNPSSYSPCIGSHRPVTSPNPSATISIAHDSEDI